MKARLADPPATNPSGQTVFPIFAEVSHRRPIESMGSFLHNWYKPHFEKALLRRL